MCHLQNFMKISTVRYQDISKIIIRENQFEVNCLKQNREQGIALTVCIFLGIDCRQGFKYITWINVCYATFNIHHERLGNVLVIQYILF